MNRFFYGWYMKCQSPVQTLAVIPAVHQVHHHRSCSIQIITDRNAWNVEFPGDIYGRSGKNMLIGKNRFGERGVHLAIRTPEITAEGTLSFRCLTPLKYDIMGPFALIPFLECRHHVWSMQHAVFGTICINGENYTFQNDCGYWEGDSGRSFPGEYLWTQCFLSGGSIMLAAADIPYPCVFACKHASSHGAVRSFYCKSLLDVAQGRNYNGWNGRKKNNCLESI